MVPDILSQIQVPAFRSKDFPVTDYGADPHGHSDSLPAFKAAILACNQASGGRVTVPAGRYIVNGPIYLRSNVNLYLEAGSKIDFGTRVADYLPPVLVRWGGVRCYNYSPLIYANNEQNIAITGSGVLNGQCQDSWAAFGKNEAADSALLQQMPLKGVPVEDRIFGAGHYLRPTFFEPYECENVWVDGVTFVLSPFWTIHPTFCKNVTISNVTVLPGENNDDGCDPDSCLNVLIENCTFTTVDDSISIKAGEAPDSDSLPGTKNVVIRNCKTVSTVWGAMTVGSNVSAGVSNVFFDGYSAGTSRNAIYIKGNRNAGGLVENINLRNCSIGQCEHLVSIIPAGYGTDSLPLVPPKIDGLSLDTVTCQNATVSAFALDGTAQNPILDVTLSNVTIESSPTLIDSTFAAVVSTGLIFKNHPESIALPG
jgi:polygalacturonase